MRSVVVLFIVAVFTVIIRSASNDGSREVTVIVRFTGAHQATLDGIRFKAITADGQSTYAECNEHGEATFMLRVNDVDRNVNITFDVGEPGKTTVEEMAVLQKRIRRFNETCFIPRDELRKMRLELAPDTVKHTVEIRMLPAIEVTGKVCGADGQQPISKVAVMTRLGEPGMARTGSDGEFVIHGVPQGISNEVFVITYPQVIGIPVASERMREDLNVGRITVPQTTPAFGTLEMRVKVRHQVRDPESGKAINVGVTLISENGSEMLTYFIVNEHMAFSFASTAPPQVPTGKWFIVPGLFQALGVQLNVRDALVKGIDVSKYGIPFVQIIAGEHTRTAVDQESLILAISELAKSRKATATQPAEN